VSISAELQQLHVYLMASETGYWWTCELLGIRSSEDEWPRTGHLTGEVPRPACKRWPTFPGSPPARAAGTTNAERIRGRCVPSMWPAAATIQKNGNEHTQAVEGQGRIFSWHRTSRPGRPRDSRNFLLKSETGTPADARFERW